MDLLDFLHDKSEKKVEYIELIYDLIFVYLVSKNGDLLHDIQGGFITAGAYLTYLASSVVILQIWYFSSLYINRYGGASIREHVGLFINMYLLYFMAGGIQVDWGTTYLRYNLAWALILVNLAVQYILRVRLGPPVTPRERHHIRLQTIILLAESAIVLITIPIYQFTGLAFSPWGAVFGFAAAILTRRVDAQVPVDFSHLSERVMLYVVFTFGEMTLGIAGYFNSEFSGMTVYYSLMAFLLVVGLFSGYGYYYDHLVNRDLHTTGTGYMLLHILLLLALSNITAALEFMRKPNVFLIPKTVFLVLSLLVYFLCLLGTQRFAVRYVAPESRFYWKLGACFAAYCVIIGLCYTRPMISMAVSVLFIFLQLYALVHVGAKRENI
jgi:low temperature requirement protein LtrA